MHSSSLQRDSHAIRMDQEEGLPAAVQKSPYHPAVIPGTSSTRRGLPSFDPRQIHHDRPNATGASLSPVA